MKDYKAQTKWKRENTTFFGVRLHNEYDKELIEHLKKQESRNAYLKQLIAEDLAKEKGN